MPVLLVATDSATGSPLSLGPGCAPGSRALCGPPGPVLGSGSGFSASPAAAATRCSRQRRRSAAPASAAAAAAAAAADPPSGPAPEGSARLAAEADAAGPPALPLPSPNAAERCATNALRMAGSRVAGPSACLHANSEYGGQRPQLWDCGVENEASFRISRSRLHQTTGAAAVARHPAHTSGPQPCAVLGHQRAQLLGSRVRGPGGRTGSWRPGARSWWPATRRAPPRARAAAPLRRRPPRPQTARRPAAARARPCPPRTGTTTARPHWTAARGWFFSWSKCICMRRTALRALSRVMKALDMQVPAAMM